MDENGEKSQNETGEESEDQIQIPRRRHLSHGSTGYDSL